MQCPAVLPIAFAPIVVARERARVLTAADRYLREAPVTITASRAARSAGGPHDYFSEADYWWPDPEHPDGPYIQRDGESNPANFDDHRKAMNRPDYLELWSTLPADSEVDEIVRNFFIRQPVLWTDGGRLFRAGAAAGLKTRPTIDHGRAAAGLKTRPDRRHESQSRATSPLLVYRGHPRSLLHNHAVDMIG